MRLAAALFVAAVLAACSDRKPAEAAEPAAPRERPLAQDGTVARAYTSAPDRARIQLDLAQVRGALQTWRIEHGAWPPDLATLRLDGLSYPKDLEYDAAAGTVRSATYPSY